MVASWVRREFGAVGVTQYRPGRHLRAIQDHLCGAALLCIDVSGSMYGAPMRAAVEGGLDFLDEAEQAGYRCGLILWHHGVADYLPTTTPSAKVRARLRAARAGGENDLVPALHVAIKELGPMRGDRVVCVFGDGDVGPERPVEREAARARGMGIRFVVRGLGSSASRCLSRTLVPDEHDETAHTVDDVRNLRRGIASMAAGLRVKP
jgi:Mg-chelatase subunit ChlD